MTLVGDADQAVAEMNPLRREAGGDDREQVRAMHGEMRHAVELFAAWVEWRSLQRASILPAPLVAADGTHGLPVERFPEAEPIEDTRRVRREVDAAPNLRQLRRLLVDSDLEAGLAQRHRGGEAADTGADDRDLERCAGHLSAGRPRRHRFVKALPSLTETSPEWTHRSRRSPRP
jgi:hypothetical protein